MQADDILMIGDKIELVKGDSRVYKTSIEDMTGNGLFLAIVPSYGGTHALLHVDDEITVSFFRATGRYMVKMQIAGFEKTGEIRYMWLLQKERPWQLQRRAAYRLSTAFKVQVCEYIEDAEEELPLFVADAGTHVLETAGSKDLSATGIALRVKWDYELGEKHLLKLFLDEQQEKRQSLDICAEVVRMIPELRKGVHSIGMQFFGQKRNMLDYLAKYVVAQQQKQIRQNRYLND